MLKFLENARISRILQILQNFEHFAQFCTFCTILHILHNLAHFAHFAHFAQFCTFCIFCTICTFFVILHNLHIFHNFAQLCTFWLQVDCGLWCFHRSRIFNDLTLCNSVRYWLLAQCTSAICLNTRIRGTSTWTWTLPATLPFYSIMCTKPDSDCCTDSTKY